MTEPLCHTCIVQLYWNYSAMLNDSRTVSQLGTCVVCKNRSPKLCFQFADNVNPRMRAKVDPEVFHKHLDVCERCTNKPFDLCPVGVRALYEAAGVRLADEKKT